jgi:hypothetical protein
MRCPRKIHYLPKMQPIQGHPITHDSVDASGCSSRREPSTDPGAPPPPVQHVCHLARMPSTRRPGLCRRLRRLSCHGPTATTTGFIATSAAVSIRPDCTCFSSSAIHGGRELRVAAVRRIQKVVDPRQIHDRRRDRILEVPLSGRSVRRLRCSHLRRRGQLAAA